MGDRVAAHLRCNQLEVFDRPVAERQCPAHGGQREPANREVLGVGGYRKPGHRPERGRFHVSDSTLRLRLTNMPYKGAIAANVVLGVAVAGGVPPLAADRVRSAVDAAVTFDGGDGPLRARREDGLATVGIRAGGEEWL